MHMAAMSAMPAAVAVEIQALVLLLMVQPV
jgi:hypothetical protein